VTAHDGTLKIGATVAPPASTAEIEARYQRRIDEVSGDAERLTRLDVRWNAARIALTFALFAVGILAWRGDLPWSIWFVLLGGLVAVAMRHESIGEQLRVARALVTCHRRQLARRRREWNDIPVPLAPPELAQDPTARDLDLFGRRSVFHWMCIAHTPRGREQLAEWLVKPAEGDMLAHRQRLVRELASEFSWRESLQLQGTLLGADASKGDQFVAWASGPGWLDQRRWLIWLARVEPLILVGLFVVYQQQVVSGAVALALLAALVFVNIVVSVLYVGAVHDLFLVVGGTSDQVGRYREMLAVAASLPASVGAIDREGDDLREVARSGIAHLNRLRTIVRIADLRRDGLFGIPVVIAHLLFLWEIHVLGWLEAWRSRYGGQADSWFRAIGELEALASLATVAHDHPEWSFAKLDRSLAKLDARGLGHPLLADDHRVPNDVRLGPAGSFLLVTGSNMSGKSTLLRSIGVNVVLGQAGGVVCAREMSFPPVEIGTSMRVSDSLADGVSLFFAELLRLKAIVDRGGDSAKRGKPLLYLLDEILHGTNSRERQTAVVRVARHLLDHGALGAISTHDLELAECAEIREACHVVHFRETLDGGKDQQSMSFDYRLREGVSPTTNALVLLRMVGLDEN
jgi:hypothetical protein